MSGHDQTPEQILGYMMHQAKTAVEPLQDDAVAHGLDCLFKELRRGKTGKGVLAVLLTSAMYKVKVPSQDIRNHQAQLPNGYSGRSLDNRHVTPFLRKHAFPAPQSSGWLTRSLEQSAPYDSKYGGNMQPPALKQAFLRLIAEINICSDRAQKIGEEIFRRLLKLRDASDIQLPVPGGLTIDQICKILGQHFQAKNSARLPEIAIHAVYEAMMPQLKRFADMKLKSLRTHTAPDSQAHEIGDITIIGPDGLPFEAVEVKHNIPLSKYLLEGSFEKFQGIPLKRFYLLSTEGTPPSKEMTSLAKNIQLTHGCQVVVNGVLPTLKYYLRLLTDPLDFVREYVKCLETDKNVSFDLKEKWKEIIQEMIQA